MFADIINLQHGIEICTKITMFAFVDAFFNT